MRSSCKALILFIVGAAVYFEIELNWRYFTNHLPVHWTMPIVGAVLFLVIGGLNEYLPWEMSILMQGFIGTIVVTLTEFFSGCVLNIMLGLNVWDYSDIPLNACGQICLPFSVAWLFLSIVAIILDDYLRFHLFGEEKPHYFLV